MGRKIMQNDSIASLVVDFLNRRKGEHCNTKIMFAELGLDDKGKAAASAKLGEMKKKNQVKSGKKLGEFIISNTFNKDASWPKKDRKPNSKKKPKHGDSHVMQILDKTPVVLPEIADKLQRLHQVRNVTPLDVNQILNNMLLIQEQNILQRYALEQVATLYEQLGQLLLQAGIIEHE